MVRNTDGLKRSARSRSEDATQRATAAILLMQAEEVDINFRKRRCACESIDSLALRNRSPVRDKIVKITAIPRRLPRAR